MAMSTAMIPAHSVLPSSRDMRPGQFTSNDLWRGSETFTIYDTNTLSNTTRPPWFYMRFVLPSHTLGAISLQFHHSIS